MNFAKFSTLTRLDQTIFSLPFLGAAVLCALKTAPTTWQLLWIAPAFLSARISGMAFNQAIDASIDAKNPRTATRLIPSGDLPRKTALKIAFGALFLFLLCSLQLDLLPLSLVAATLIGGYSFTKRLHFSCHFVLGLIHFLAPIMAWKAISGAISLPSLFLGLTAFFVVSGSDILYAMQDYEFDRREDLHSMPTKVGLIQARRIAKVCHFLSLVAFTAFGITLHAKALFFFGPLIPLLFFKRQGLFLNTTVSLSLFTFTLLDQLWHVSL